MMPVLYPADETSFGTNGLGALADAYSCTVNEVLNGAYTLTMTYPADGIHAKDIASKMILKVRSRDDSSASFYDLFRISKVQESLDGKKLTINANHISYDLAGYPIEPFTAVGIANILDAFADTDSDGHCLVPNDFTFHTNLTNTTSTFNSKIPKSVRACIGGMEGSLLQTFRCELLFDNKDVYLLTRRGADNGVIIAYGKNLESYVSVKSAESSYNGVLAYWLKDNVTVYSDVQYAQDADFPVDRIYIYDVSTKYEEQPTVSNLNNDALSYITQNNIGQSYLESVSVSFIPLWQTEEYKNIAQLERVALGDTVTVIYGARNFKTRVVECTYDVLRERYTNVVLGEKKASFGDTIKQISVEATNELLTVRGI